MRFYKKWKKGNLSDIAIYIKCDTSKGCKTYDQFKSKLKEVREKYIGRQDVYMNLTKDIKKNILVCNITGRINYLSQKMSMYYIKKYGSLKNAQQIYMCPKYVTLSKKYGHAWIWLQRTPGFVELRNKLQFKMKIFNETSDKNEVTLKKFRDDCDKLVKKYNVYLTRPIFYKKLENQRIDGLWLKGLPFIFDIFIPYESEIMNKNIFFNDGIENPSFSFDNKSSDVILDEDYVEDELRTEKYVEFIK